MNEFITGIIKLKNANAKGKEFVKYSYVRNREQSISKFMSFAKKSNGEYVNFYYRNGKFFKRINCESLTCQS